MRTTYISALLCAVLVLSPIHAGEQSGNRLTYLDGADPYYVSAAFPKLTTPQWVGEEGVEAVIVLAIDDMRDTARYEEYLRPILQRLKEIDGRAPVSIMTNNIKPDDPQLRSWLDEGLSIEIHTVDHPCPLLQKDDFAKAKSTYDRCIDMMNNIPGNKPAAFRMPCCDSLNTVSPRFFAEIFNNTTPQNHFLTISTSVFNVFTPDDPEIPRELLIDPDGKDKFKKYVPYDRSFVNTIENYPYPYVINGLCWEFPCVAPSDWSAQHYHQEKCSPLTVRDLKAAIDITVRKRGVLNLVFHPHGWIRNDQIVELIDHAAAKHGKKIKFLNFREAQDRLDKNLLAGAPLRNEKGRDNGVRLMDVNNDGYLDVVIGNENKKTTRLWSSERQIWNDVDFPTLISRLRFGIHQSSGFAAAFSDGLDQQSVWHYQPGGWRESKFPIPADAEQGTLRFHRRFRLRDLDHDGRCELILCDTLLPDDHRTRIFKLSESGDRWELLEFSLPEGCLISTLDDADSGLRFIDINDDGYEDLIFSNHQRYSVHLFESMQTGWSKELLSGLRGKKSPEEELPMIVRQDGSNGGFWAHTQQLWWQNEQTAKLKDLVARRSFEDLRNSGFPGPQSPEESLRSIVVRPGFRVELVASEPLVKDPVAFEWGANGKLWVVEMADYPVGLDGKGKPGGRIRVLDDTNGDGKYDHSALFLDEVSFPSGIMPWRKGVLITAAPDILYAQDTNGDGRADHQEILYTGFGQGNQQHRVNGLTWGLDNWIYCANGDSGGRVRSTRTGETINISGRDIRIRPDTGGIDPQLGSTQFVRSRDNWGNWFGNNNSNPMYQYVLQDHYLRRNPHLLPPEGRKQVSINPGPAPCYPISRTLARFNDLHRANRFTSACSAIIYRDELFGPGFLGNSFVCEPVHNLVHREIMSVKGVEFSSRRADDEQKSEFLASRDNWFRPTMIKTGPDGAIYIADMYRKVIEHTQYIPKELQAGLDVRAGEDRGRIYRVVPTGKKPRQIPNLQEMTTSELVKAFDSPNGWQRDTVQQLLVTRRDRDAVELLKTTVKNGKRPLARLHALCTLDGLNQLSPAILMESLKDPHPGVRRHAVRLSEPFLKSNRELGKAVLKRLEDSNPHVLLQLAYTLGEWRNDAAHQGLGLLAIRHANDRYMMAAIISSVNLMNVDAILSAVLESESMTNEDDDLISRMLILSSTVGDHNVLHQVFSFLEQAAQSRDVRWAFDTIAKVLNALERRQTTIIPGEKNYEANVATERKRLVALFDNARDLASDVNQPDALRVAAVGLLARSEDHLDRDIALLSNLLDPIHSGRLQFAAARRLGELDDGTVPSLLIARWKTYGPKLRSEILDIFFRRSSWLETVLSGIEAGDISAAELDASRREQLLNHRSAKIRDRAEKVFAGVISPDRRKILAAYSTALLLEPNLDNGKKQFEKTCSTCHKLDGVGHEVGPNLAAMKNKSSELLLVAILDPNQNVESKYINYMAVTTAGKTYNGILADETGESISLLAPKGERISLLRSELEILQSTSKSTMPEGLEKDLKPQDICDLMAYIRRVGATRVPENQAGRFPRTSRAGKDGSLLLLATQSEIYGDTLVLEEKYDNLGFWQSSNDRAIWPLFVAQSGSYDVWLHWACDKPSEGKTLSIECGKSKLTARIESTGSWDNYRRKKLGVIDLPAGAQRLIVQPEGPIRGSLLDLKSLRLVPRQSEPSGEE